MEAKSEIKVVVLKIGEVYESKYGNTRLVAETIAERLRGAKGTKADIAEFKEVDFGKVPEYDAILVGTPNHFGGPVGGAKKFVDELGKLRLEGKFGAAFDTYMGSDFEKAVGKLEKRMGEKAPGLKLLAPGLSVKVAGMKGPIPEEELAKCKDFADKIVKQIKKVK